MVFPGGVFLFSEVSSQPVGHERLGGFLLVAPRFP